MISWQLSKDPALGYDTAKWQGKEVPFADGIDLGIQWMIGKCWHGRGEAPDGPAHIAQAKNAGLEVRGRYAWFLPKSNLDLQIGAWVGPSAWPDDELPLMIDHEEPEVEAKGRPLVTALEYVIEKVSDRMGRRPIIYTGSWYWQGWCGDLDSDIVASCPLALAAYPHKNSSRLQYHQALEEVLAGPPPTVPKPWALRGIEPIIWQFDGDKGLVLPNGVDVDVNVASWSQLRALIPALAAGQPIELPADPRGAPTDIDQVLDMLAEPPKK